VKHLVYQAGGIASEIHRLRLESQDLPTEFLEGRERLLQILLANISQRATAQDLVRDDGNMECMHYVQHYRRAFPYFEVVGQHARDLPIWPSSIHGDIEQFLKALPLPSEFEQQRLAAHFGGANESANGVKSLESLIESGGAVESGEDPAEND
jgi:hypothetical protein